MRKFIAIITEMPISALHWQDADPKQDTSFSAMDRKLLSSPKAREKIIRAFDKTPFNFEIHFIATNTVEGDSEYDNDEVDLHCAKIGAGIHDSFDYGEGEIRGKRGVITVLQLGNLSPQEAKMPMTAWTLAHKIGHALQDDVVMCSWVGETARCINQINRLIKSALSKHTGRSVKMSKDSFDYPFYIDDFMTMKSARDGKLTQPFEQFAEMVAQYLINGAVVLSVNDDAQAYVKKINHIMYSMFEKLQGKILVET